MGPIVKHRFPALSLVCLAWLVLGCVLGCARHKPAPLVTTAPEKPVAASPATTVPAHKAQQSQAAYDQGMRAFDAGEFKKATAVWRACLADETDPAARQRVFFALIAVKLVQAGNEADLTTAMDMFEAWLKDSPPGGSGEDARLLAPVLRTFRPAFALKELKAAGEKECAKKLAERTEQVRRMQQQVKALETIHREIQEKKKGLNNY